jgi:membrane protein
MAEQTGTTGRRPAKEGVWYLMKQTFNEWSADNAMTLGAALAYYATFSLAPLLVIIVAVSGFFLGQETTQATIVSRVQESMGPAAAGYIRSMISAAYPKGGEGVAAVIGVVVLFLGATSVFVMLTQALNIIWKVDPNRNSGLAHMVITRLLSLVMMLIIGFILLLSVVLTTGVRALLSTLTAATALPPAVFLVAEGVISFLIITLLFAAIFKVLPDTKIAWRDLWIGAVVTAVLFTGGKYVLGLYLGRGGVASAYGVAGSLVVILLWIYYSAQIFLFGAEFTQVYARIYGSRAEG